MNDELFRRFLTKIDLDFVLFFELVGRFRMGESGTKVSILFYLFISRNVFIYIDSLNLNSHTLYVIKIFMSKYKKDVSYLQKKVLLPAWIRPLYCHSCSFYVL